MQSTTPLYPCDCSSLGLTCLFYRHSEEIVIRIHIPPGILRLLPDVVTIDKNQLHLVNGVQLVFLDHVLTTSYNNRPHLTTFFGDCFDGFNKRYNQLVFNSLITTNELTIIPTYHQSSSSRPRHKKDSLTAVFFRATCLRLTGDLIPQTLRGPLILLLKKRSRVGSLTRSVPQHLPGKRLLAWKVPVEKAGPSRKTAPGMEGPRKKGRTFQENGLWHGRSEDG